MLSFSSSGINSIDARIWSRLLPKTTQQLFYCFSGFPRLTDFTYYGMNKYFLLATRPELFNTYHNFLLPRVASNAGKKKIPFRTQKKTRTGSFFVHTPETQSTLCGCLRFSSFLSHTAHKTALDTSAARKRGYLPFTNNPDQINFHDQPTRMIRDTVQIFDVAAPKEPPESAAAHRKRARVSSFQQIAMRRRRCGCWLQ